MRHLALIAAVASIALTGAAFWLSYEHLHDVAAVYGLGPSAARSWAWPATVDLFILIGEVLILRAALNQAVDPWAIALTVVGSSGSIALNVAGVGAHAQPMAYVVAAVPPIAALLAFGALMRQIHEVLADRLPALASIPVIATTTAQATVPVAIPEAAPVASGASEAAADEPPVVALPVAASTPPTGDKKTDNSAAKTAAKKPPTGARRAARSVAKKKPQRRPLDEWVEIAGPVFHAEFARLRRNPTANEFATAIGAAGLGLVSDSTAKNIRAEILDRTELPALD
ncbi:DUF2637 domain-containing protein [Streptomyces sp. NPDC052000]|uniref:DUF2637 domain-containing protein n=1 Tax=Streptomyces sp. NPDC052000 TaxID=3155676 RepID=UPI00344BC042